MRNRRPWRRLAVALLAAGILPLVAGCRPDREAVAPASLAGGARGWNLLLLSVDTVRADRLGSFGYAARANSPRLDALVESGVRFGLANAPRAATWPSLASVLTGLYPSGHGVIRNGYRFPEDLPLLPTVLRQAGYQTAAFIANMCQAGHRGWDAYRCTRGVDGRVSSSALAWLGEIDRSRPFFLWTHYFGAHPPYYNGGKLADRELDPGYSGPVAPKKSALDRIMTEPVPLDAADRRHLDAVYDAAVMGTDRIAGGLLEGLRRQGLLERTLVVFLADHGEELYQHHGYLYHACSVYQSTLHVPLAFVAPGLLAGGGTVRQPVELIDVMPTVLELLGIAVDTPLHGKSLVPYLARPEASGAGRPAFSEYDDTRVRTVLAGRWKLVWNPDDFLPYCFEGAPRDLYPLASVELYDLESDPGELRNVAAEHPDTVAALEALIEHRFSGLDRRDEAQEIPEELKQELRALGYVAD